MKLLIITAWYRPFIHPRAHRWTALAEHWASEGHEVHVVTTRQRGCAVESEVNGVQVHRTGFDSLKEIFYYWFGVKNGRGRVGVATQKPGLLTRLANPVYNVFWKNIYFPDDAWLWYFPAKKKAEKLLAQRDFDAVITVSLPFTGHLVGLSLSCSAYQRTKWIADVGDPFSIQAKSLNNSFLYGKLSRRLERQVLESADAVTVTTSFTLNKYRDEFGETSVTKMHVVPPLLHPLPPATAAHTGKGVGLKLAYFGALYSPIRTPDAFLDLLERTFALRPDLQKRMEVHFYGEIFPEFYNLFAKIPAIQLHGLRSREEVQIAMRDADILLNIGNITDFQLPSKAVEYLAAGKPVVNLSYTDDDPFTTFFEGNDLILNLKVKNGRVGEESMQRWLAWLEGERKEANEVDLEKLAAPYKVEVISKCYLDLAAR